MATIAEIRARLPSLEGLSDEQALSYLQQRYAPDVPLEALAQRLGVKIAAPEVNAPKRSLMAVANDTVIEAANAAAGTVGAVGNFIDPGNAVSKAIDDNIIRPGEESQSDAVKADKAKFRADMEGAQGIGDEVAAVGRYVAGSPLQAAAQAAGSFAIPGAAVKGAGALGQAVGLGAKGVSRAGMAGGAVLGGAGAGGDAAGTAYELAIKAGATEEQAQDAARKASAIPAAIGAAGGLVGAERVLAGAGGFKGGLMARALKTAGVEGVQEGVEEGVTQYEGQRAAMPFDQTIDPMKGAAGAAAMGAVLGAATGGGVALLERKAAADKGLADLTTASTPDQIIDAALRATDVPLVAPTAAPAQSTDRAQTAAEIRQLDPAQHQEALGLLATAENPRASPAVRRMAQNRLDEMLLPWRQPPAGEATDLSPELISADVGLAQFRSPAQIAADGKTEIGAASRARQDAADTEARSKPLPTGEATELTPDEIELETIPQPDVIEAGDGTLPPGMAPRTPKHPEQAPAKPMTDADIVHAVVDGFRKTNTPQARAFVQDFDAGRIKPADVLALVGRPPKSPDQRIADAAAQAPQKTTIQPGDILTVDGQPFGTRSGAYVRAKKDGGNVIEVPGGWAVRPKESVSEQPDVAGVAGRPAGAGNGRGAADPRGGGNLRPDADGAAGVDRVGPTPAPGSGGGAAVAVAPGGEPDAALSDDLATLKRAWSDAVARGDTEGAKTINDRIVAVKAKKVDTSAQPAQETPKSEQVAANDADAEERALKAGNFKEVIRLRKERKKAERAAVGDITDGVVLRHEEGRRFVMVLPDVDGGGKWRIQRFDAQGFSGHMVFKDQEEALEAALGEGFKTRDDGAMDRMQDTPEWERGMFAADLIQKVNGKVITRDEGDRLLAEFDAKKATTAAYPATLPDSKPAEEDPFTVLFGTPEQQAESQARFVAAQEDERQRKEVEQANVKRVQDSIASEKKRATVEHDDWAGRVYRANKTQVELQGDGPSKNASMSIGAINESRRRNAMEALAQELKALDKLDAAIKADSGKVMSNLRDMMQKAERAVASGNWPGQTVDEMFQSMLLDELKFRGPGGKGSVTSNGLSRAMLAALKGEPKVNAAPKEPQPAPDGQPAEGTVGAAPTKPKVYKTKDGATKARIELGNTHKVQKVKGGFILREKTDKELAAETKNGRRLGGGSVDVENDSLLTAIAKLGGLSMKERPDTIGTGNKNVGGKMLFTRTGANLDELANGALTEYGYIPAGYRDNPTTWLRDAIRSEFMGGNTYHSEQGTEWMEEAQRQHEETYPVDADPLDDFSVDELDDAGYTQASPEAQALTEQLIAEAESLGIDTEGIREDVAQRTIDEATDVYHAAVQEALRAAIAKARADAAGSNASAAQGSGQDRGEPAGDQGEAQGLTPAKRGPPVAEGDRIRFTSNDGQVIDGMAAQVLDTSGGNYRIKIRTDEPSPQGGGNISRTVYSQDGTFEPLDDAPLLAAQTQEDIRAKAEREEAATKAAAAKKAAEQERLRKEAEARDLKARADATVDDFQLGQDATQQMSGMGDMFAAAPPRSAPAPTADPFADDYAALVGKTIEQTVTTDDGKTAKLRMDAARALRDFDQREKTLADLKACLGRNG